MISMNSSNATKSLWLNDVAKAIFLASLKSVKGTFSGIANTGTRFTSITSPVTLPIRSISFWLLPLVPITINVG